MTILETVSIDLSPFDDTLAPKEVLDVISDFTHLPVDNETHDAVMSTHHAAYRFVRQLIVADPLQRPADGAAVMRLPFIAGVCDLPRPVVILVDDVAACRAHTTAALAEDRVFGTGTCISVKSLPACRTIVEDWGVEGTLLPDLILSEFRLNGNSEAGSQLENFVRMSNWANVTIGYLTRDSAPPTADRHGNARLVVKKPLSGRKIHALYVALIMRQNLRDGIGTFLPNI